MCGNLTLLGRLSSGETRALPARARDLMEAMLEVTQVRGAQSGGAALVSTQGGLPRQQIVKCVNPKRGNLARRLTKAVEKHGRARPFEHSYLIQTHVRFATSAPATREESHPFRFLDRSRRGARRLFDPKHPGKPPTVRPVETAITHNGDMDAFIFRGVRVPHPQLGTVLARLLDAPYRWQGDSPSLAGLFELYLTAGLWAESFRLCYLEELAPPLPYPTKESAGQTPDDALANALADYPVVAWSTLHALAAIAEAVWAETTAAPEDDAGRAALAERLGAALWDQGGALLPAVETRAQADAYSSAVVNAFLDNNLFRAARRIEAAVEGTFGCLASSTLEPHTVVAFARSQPLSIGVHRESGTVAIVSERNALRITDRAGAPCFDARLDFSLDSAEVLRVVVRERGAPLLTLYNVATDHTYTAGDLETSGRLVTFADNPLLTALPSEPKDRIHQDLLDTPEVLNKIRIEFSAFGSYSQETALALSRQLLGSPGRKLWVLGVTGDLWLGQQFVRNLRVCLPNLEAIAISSNEVLREPESHRPDADTVVLAISQSGQDFPTLGAVQLMRGLWPEGHEPAIFALTGEADTLMAQSVGQSMYHKAPWIGRVLVNHGGHRPSEAATVAISAMQATLCEMLLFLCRRALTEAPAGLEVAIDKLGLDALRDRRDTCVKVNVPAIVASGEDESHGAVAKRVATVGRRWGYHVLEGVAGFLGAFLMLQANLQWNLPLRPSRLLAWLSSLVEPGSVVRAGLSTVGTQVDIVYYLFLTPLFIWLLRLLQGRTLLDRQGVRELLIGDVHYVRQSAWLLARRLFSRSYGFASIKAYTADSQDDLVLTHEPVRGNLALIGLPDSRHSHLRSHSGAATMGAKQFASSRSVAGSGAEVVTLGPTESHAHLVTHLALPQAPVSPQSRAVEQLIEGMYDSLERLIGMQVLLARVARTVASFHPLGYDPSRTKDQVFAPTTAAPVSAAGVPQVSAVRAAERYTRISLPFDVTRHSGVSGILRLTRSSTAMLDASPPNAKQPAADVSREMENV